MLLRVSRLVSHGDSHRFWTYDYAFMSVLPYSTTNTDSNSKTHFLVDYLVSSLGFSREEAKSATKRLITSTSSRDPDLAVNFLKQVGLSKTQIKTVISGYPSMLLCHVDNTLKPKMAFLQELGLSLPGIIRLLQYDTSYFGRSLDVALRPNIHYLRQVLGSDENVAKALMRTPLLVSCSSRRLKPNVLFLQELGVPKEKIDWLVVRRPRIMTYNPCYFKEIVMQVEKEFGIGINSGMFPHGIVALGSGKISAVERNFGIFQSYGWSRSDILTLFRNLPYCLRATEVKLRKALDFFMKELGLKPDYLASHPKLIMFSHEKRVLPRLEVMRILNENKLNKKSLYTFLSLGNSYFLKECVLRYKDSFPDLHKSYMNIQKPREHKIKKVLC